MLERIAILLALVACNETRKLADDRAMEEPSTPTPPKTTERTVTRGRADLSDLGFAVSLEVPAGTKLLWLDSSPDELGHKAATARVSHDAGDTIFREQGLRLFVRRPVPREPTELSRMEAWLPRERDRLQAELDELQLEGDEGKLELSVAHRETTRTGWELAWSYEGDDGAYFTKVWRADLKLFCIDMMASRETIAGTLATCRTLTMIR